VAGLLDLVGFRRAARHERAGFALYSAAVATARDSRFYRSLGVPDTLDGRFDLIAVHAFLLIHRLQDAPDPGPALAQAVFDAMFSDMDNNLREIGVSDLSVGKRMRAMWEAFHGRCKAYATAIDAGDSTALEAALSRNVWRGASPPGAAASLTRIVISQTARLAEQPLEALASGKVEFMPKTEALP